MTPFLSPECLFHQCFLTISIIFRCWHPWPLASFFYRRFARRPQNDPLLRPKCLFYQRFLNISIIFGAGIRPLASFFYRRFGRPNWARPPESLFYRRFLFLFQTRGVGAGGRKAFSIDALQFLFLARYCTLWHLLCSAIVRCNPF